VIVSRQLGSGWVVSSPLINYMSKEKDTQRKLLLQQTVKYLPAFVKEAKRAIYRSQEVELSAEEFVDYLYQKYTKR
jgi:hypothetical protein